MVFQPFWSLKGCQFWPFWSSIGYGFCTVVLNWVCFSEEATFLSEVLHDDFNLAKYNAGLRQGIDLGSGHS